MTSVIAEEWPDAPLEICQYVLSFVNIMPTVRKEFIIPDAMDLIALLDRNTLCVAKRFSGDLDCYIFGDDFPLPIPVDDRAEMFPVNGAVYCSTKSLPKKVYVVKRNEAPRLLGENMIIDHLDHDGTDVYAISNNTIAVLDPYVEPVVRDCVVCTDDDLTYAMPWITACVYDNAIAYMTVKYIDGIPQKIAVLGDL